MMQASLFRSLSSSSVSFKGRSQRLLPRRSNCLSAERRISELNIMGHEAIVSTEYTVEKIKEAQASSRITKLELEDLVNREGDTASLTIALRNLLSRDSNRAWQYIKFVDSLPINNSPQMSAANQLQRYARKKQNLWDEIRRYNKNKPIMFTVKLEVEMGTSVSTLCDMLRVLNGLKDLTRIEFGGALYDVKQHNVPYELANLFSVQMDSASSHSNSSTSNISDDGPYLSDKIVFSLFCVTPDCSPVNNATAFLRECKRQLRNLTKPTPSNEDTEIDLSVERTCSTRSLRGGPERGVLRRSKSRQAGLASDVLRRTQSDVLRRTTKSDGLRRTKTSGETGRSRHDYGSDQLSIGNRRNGSFTRSKPMNSDRLRTSLQSLPRSKRLAQSDRSLNTPRDLLTKERGNKKGEQTEPDFQWEKLGASHDPAFKSHLSPGSKPPAGVRSLQVTASTA